MRRLEAGAAVWTARPVPGATGPGRTTWETGATDVSDRGDSSGGDTGRRQGHGYAGQPMMGACLPVLQMRKLRQACPSVPAPLSPRVGKVPTS